MEKNCKIGLVQMESIVGQTNKNLNKIIKIAEETANEGVNILCFPEMALQGYSPALAKELGLNLSSFIVKTIREFAESLDVTLLIGMAELAADSAKPYLTQLIAFPDGRISSYRKVHLGRSEQEYFAAGDSFPVFTSHGVKFGVGICWDWHFPELATIYSLKGAEVLFAPHASPVVSGDRKEIWLRYLGARAYDNSVYLGACNLIGENGQGKNFSGGTLILGPKGDILTETASVDLNSLDKVLTADLSANRINKLRTFSRTTMKESFFLADRRKELYKELVELEINKT